MGDSGGRPNGIAIEDSTAIAASAEAIWAVLADVDGWGRWNPVYPEARGTMAIGGTIAMTIRLPGMKSQKSVAKVVRCEPAREVWFGASVFGGLLRATRYITIAPAGDGGCHVVNGEAFAGLLGGLMARKIGSRIAEGLRMASAGLKRTAEAR
jgi:hypothetical protein